MLRKAKEKNESTDKKGAKRLKRLFFLLSSGALTIALGIGAGFLLHSLSDKPETITIKAGDLKVDEEGLMAKYKESKNYDGLAPWEMANIALILHGEASSSFSYSEGSAVAMGLVKQNIHSAAIRVGDKWFEESLSKSEGSIDIQTGWRMYEDSSHLTDLYKSKDKSISGGATSASWDPSSKKSFATNEEFKKEVGFALSSHRSNYNITEYTVISEESKVASGDGPSLVKKTDIGYDVEIELDVKLACEDYKTQMVHTSSLYSRPNFFYSHLRFHLDALLYPISIEGHEKYHAATSAILGSDVEANMTTYYFRDGGFKIPELNENIAYQHP
ncbi:MAG: hypothetical protein J6328_07450 [Bacilli bacterium]|nr:hypothetical protein [Bacilli bacterium]